MSRELVSKRDSVRKVYFAGDYINLHSLSVDYNINYNTMLDWIYKGRHGEISWRDEKKSIEEEIKSHAIEVAKNKLATTYSKTSFMMDDILDRVKEGIESGIFNMKDLPDIYAKLATALKNVHSTMRLEDGKSTQNIAVSNIKLEDNLQDALKHLEDSGLINPEELSDIEIIDEEKIN